MLLIFLKEWQTLKSIFELFEKSIKAVIANIFPKKSRDIEAGLVEQKIDYCKVFEHEDIPFR